MTRSGKFLCLITIGIGFGAVNTGNNLLFLLLGMLLSLILASGVLSEAVLREVRAKRKLPDRFIAGTGAPGAFVVKNDKKYASLSIAVTDRNAVGVAGPARGQELGPKTVAWWKFWKGDPEESPIAGGYSVRLDAATEEALDARFMFDVRGRYRLETLRIVTRFPFGLFEKARRIEKPVEVTVFPAGIDASDWVATVWGRFGEVPLNRRGQGDDFYGLREYRTGEDRRRIHWKSTARRGEPVVREDEALTQREVEVVFVDWDGGAPLSAATFERGVSKTVGLINALAERGWRVGLSTRESQLEPDLGSRHVDRMFGALAVVEPHPEAAQAAPANGQVARIVVGSAKAVAAWTGEYALALPFEEVRDA